MRINLKLQHQDLPIKENNKKHILIGFVGLILLSLSFSYYFLYETKKKKTVDSKSIKNLREKTIKTNQQKKHKRKIASLAAPTPLSTLPQSQPFKKDKTVTPSFDTKLSSFKLQELPIEDLSLVKGLYGTNRARKEDALYESRGIYFYPYQNKLIENVFYSKKKRKYGVWTGVIMVKSMKAGTPNLNDYHLNHLQSFGMHHFYQIDQTFTEQDLQRVYLIDNYEVKLDIKYTFAKNNQ